MQTTMTPWRRTILWSALFASIGLAQTGSDTPVRNVTDPGVVTTRQAITPAGVQSVFPVRVYGVRFGKTADDLHVITANDVVHLNWKRNAIVSRMTNGGESAAAFTGGLQGLAYDRGSDLLLAAGMTPKQGSNPIVTVIAIANAGKRQMSEGIGEHLAGAPAIAVKPNRQGEQIAVVPLTFNNQLAIFDVAKGVLLRKAKTEIAPFGAVLNAEGSVAYVSNWGGREPVEGDMTLPTGLAPDADQVVVDRFGVASTGSVTRVDVATGKATHSIPVGLHPTGMALDEAAGLLYVANGNEDSVSIINLRQNRVTRTFHIQPFATKAKGVAPTALAISGDGATLYAACGGINAVAVIDTRKWRVEGLIPTGWYPNGLDLSPDGKDLAISTLLGVGSGWRDDERKRFVLAYRGAAHVVELPNDAQLENYTLAVAENNRMLVSSETRAEAPRRNAKPTAIPRRAGEPSLIEHVVYIIKENRTYDQVFGDMPKGNGDPSLVMFGERITPNQHRLADQFVLLDNFYATGGNSADGHQWVTQANEADYAMWPGYRGRSYPYDGTDPIAYTSTGFIWDLAAHAGKSVRVYGEFAGHLSLPSTARPDLLKRVLAGEDFSSTYNIEAPLKPLNRYLAKNYPSYSTSIPDLIRAQILRKDIERWEREGTMPNLVIAQLPSNHTFGTRPGTHTPAAMVADNDWALGQIVETLSQTRFWKKMLILVVEDDAQNGVDHVDGHRTTALAIGPYVRRDAVDSTFYAQQSMLKTIELIFGLPNMSIFDLIANDMRASFTDTPDFRGYTAVKPEQPLDAVNPQVTALSGPAREAAEASMKMRFEVPDAAPTDRVNRILWHTQRGWDTPYPGVNSSVFAPLSSDVDDDDREVVEEGEQ